MIHKDEEPPLPACSGEMADSFGALMRVAGDKGGEIKDGERIRSEGSGVIDEVEFGRDGFESRRIRQGF